MAVVGQFHLIDYTNSDGQWKLHFVNHDPGPGMPNDFFIDIPESELPANINQNQLSTQLKQRLGWAINQTFAPLNQFINAGTIITLP